MNAVMNNDYTEGWQRIGQQTIKPKGILAISAHWFVSETGATIATSPTTIHDLGGFPQELFKVQYPASGDPALVRRVQKLLAPLDVKLDNTWGLDHGTWSVHQTALVRHQMIVRLAVMLCATVPDVPLKVRVCFPVLALAPTVIVTVTCAELVPLSVT
jgi:aromatic ring-opening dioxygenase catalytic subunit (LigB family)